MNFDRNTIIGFIILALLFFGFFYYTKQQQLAVQKQKAISDSTKRAQDSIANLTKPKQAPVQQGGAGQIQNPVNAVDSNLRFVHAYQGTEQLTTVETELLKIVFTNKGGQPKSVELKKFKAPDSSNVKLASTNFDKIDYSLIADPRSNNKTDSVSGLFFSGGQIQKSGDVQTITYQLQSNDGNTITHTYTVKKDYMIDFDLSINGVSRLLSNNTLFLRWQNRANQLQKDMEYEKSQSQVSFYAGGDYDYYNIASRNEKEWADPVKWVSVKQQFFNSAIVAKEGQFSSGRLDWMTPAKGATIVEVVASLKYSLPNPQSGKLSLGLYYGPTDYRTLKQYGNDMEDMVNLGTGMFAFVKYINRWIVIPVFDFLATLTSNYGIVILLLTLFIRLITSPLMYPGYLTSAKMKILRPELEQLKAKYPDQQQYAMEQMKFMREAGVNQFAGCLPGLLQIPIFFALYSFFNSSVDLRGQGFLWTDDLSQYDSVLNLPFNIPFYGDHVSLFTITAVVTSFLISLYSLSSTPDQGNPVLKYMPYFFPVILLFIFNKLPSGLTWYYTVSNIVTLILQFVIQNYIINHDRLIAQIEANRKKPKKQSKWQERIAQMQEQQKQMREAQNKNRR